jgi:hypothetical protein
MAIQIGKYKRPGIFIEEFDQSVISSPRFEGINNLVIGVSKKGPVNTPILLKNINDLEAVFGQLDRNMERKGSYFHRTIAKMLESSPVYALNLLLTDDNLDTIEYQSLSAASNYTNDVEREGPYRRFFDTTGFWKRDTESFINLTKNNTGYAERIINFTNLSDKYITVFIVKSKLTGFDRTLIEWYGSVEKMPPYVNSNDYASDYMVDVVVVGGDWSNYQELAVDNRWSAYFNSSGLRKEQLRNFANDRNVTLLAYYEGLSLIPYFRDSNGRNIFIETVINRDTDRTGLFCAFNSELLETDYPNGLVDLLGNGIAQSEEMDINFLSYKETITESVVLPNVILDRPGNVISFGGTAYGNPSRSQLHGRNVGISNIPSVDGTVKNGNRTGWYAEDFVFNTKLSAISSTTASIVVSYGEVSPGDGMYAVVGGKSLVIEGATFSIQASSYPPSGVTASFTVAFVVDGTGNFVMVDNILTSSNPVVNSSDIVLGYVTFNITNNVIDTGSVTYNPVSIDSSGFVDLVLGVDYQVTESTPGSITIELLNTANSPNSSNYKQFRKIKYFNKLLDGVDGSSKNRMSMIINYSSMTKKSLENMSVTNIVTASTQNKSLTINTGLTSAEIVDIVNEGYLLFYLNDDEFIVGPYKAETKDGIAILTGTSSTSDGGVVSKYSDLYIKYINGIINSGDYFWSNLVNSDPESSAYGVPEAITFIDGEDVPSGTASASGYDYIIFYSSGTFSGSALANLSVNDVISVPSSSLNKGTFTILTGGGAAAATLAAQLGYIGSGYYAYKVNEETVSETLFESNGQTGVVYNYLKKHYLRMYIDGLNRLSVSFMDPLLQSYEPVDVDTNQVLFIQSNISNYKQSIEIETNVNGYIQQPNKILVNGSRYTEVKVGDFLEAYVDTTTLVPGEVPRRLTRILSKRAYAGDPTLTEITCDSRIATYNFNGDYQTFRYTTIEDYVSTYKAITLKGFRVRQDSLPDGTEVKQNQILNLVAKGTPLFKALINKESLDFRYLVDSFGLGLTERSKQQLVDICGNRLDVFGFINMPSLRQFKNSTSPSFVNSEGVLQIEYVSKGGDPESNPAFLYSFGDGPGTTCTGYFTPYVTVNDNGRPIDVPPAMFVATTYMRKHTSNVSAITPWTIAAGVTNGKVTNIAGLEMDFTLEDIEWLNQAQMNPIVFKRNRGWIIETENTAQTLYKSALSYIHVREVLIELERELSRMLLDFQWKFNTPEVRAEIKLRADVICETYVSRNGLYNYFNKIDEENNTPEIIDNQIGVLDTYVEPIKGMGIIVNNITILRTGAISAGGFING